MVLWHDKYGWPSWRVFFVMINVCCDVVTYCFLPRVAEGLWGRRLVYKMRHVAEFVDFFCDVLLVHAGGGEYPTKGA